MPWSPPGVPSSGTTITVAFATSLINNGLHWLRQLTGNGDPTASNQVIVSTSTSTSTWQQIQSAQIATGGVADSNLATQKVRAATPTPSSTFSSLMVANGNGFFELATPADGPVGSRNWYGINHLDFQNPTTYGWQLAMDIADQNELYARVIAAGTPGTWRKLFHAGNLTSANGAVPSGLIGAFRTAAGIASGWSRFTDGDGRMLIGAGTTFSVTFTENTAVGSSWAHQHASTGLTASSGGIPAHPGDAVLVNVGSTTNVSANGHLHGAPTITMGGNTANTTFTPVARIVVWAEKS